MKVRKVGILAGADPSLPEALLQRVNALGGGEVTAEFCRLGAVSMNQECPYRVLVDRVSHGIPYYLEYTKNAALSGAYVINNPFRFFSDKFFSYCVADRLGVATPRTAALPQKAYGEDVEEGDTRNLELVDWEAVIDYVGFPAVLKPSKGYAWRDVSVVHDMRELMAAYDRSGQEVMTLQEFIDFDHYVRVFVFAKEHVMPIRYDPGERRYIVDHGHLSPTLGERIVRDSVLLSEALDYDMNTCEFAVKDGVPYAIDFVNLVPDSRPESITPFYFEWVVEHMARMCVDIARSNRVNAFWNARSPLGDLAGAGKVGALPAYMAACAKPGGVHGEAKAKASSKT